MSSAAASSAAGMLAAARWAVLGDVLNSAKPASRIVQRLRSNAKHVHLVNPRAPTAADASPRVWASLPALLESERIDVLDLVINPVEGQKQLAAVPASVGPFAVFIQPGAESAEIRELCKQRQWPVHEGCVLREMPSKL